MKNDIAVQIYYKGGGGGLTGLDEITRQLKDEYVITIKPDNRPQSGGLFDALIHVIVNTSLPDFIFGAVAGGLVWDLVKIGTKKFILRPLFDALAKLEVENENLDFSSLAVEYDDATIYFHGIQRGFISSVGFVFNEIHANHQNLFNDKSKEIYEIHIPVVDYEGRGHFVRGDIEYECDFKMYSSYWGFSYNYGFETNVWDVQNKIFLDKEWTVQPKYDNNIDINELG